MQAERAALGTDGGVHYVDLSSSFCSSEQCEVIRGPLVLFSDAHHLTASFAETLARPLQVALQDALGSTNPLFAIGTVDKAGLMKSAR